MQCHWAHVGIKLHQRLTWIVPSALSLYLLYLFFIFSPSKLWMMGLCKKACSTWIIVHHTKPCHRRKLQSVNSMDGAKKDEGSSDITNTPKNILHSVSSQTAIVCVCEGVRVRERECVYSYF
jgi:hypothetical protein